jgi:phospho-N-acetylmuramoyl-pentapeptide-transferase
VSRLLIAVAIAGIVSLVGTRLLIDALTRLRIGQPIREDGPQGHRTKAGTPTMGGVAIVGGAIFGYVGSDLAGGGIFTRTGLIVMGTIVGGGLVGLMDDWIKVVRERNLGLNKRAKMLGLLTVAVAFGVLMVQFTTVPTTISFTRYDSIGWEIGEVAWVLWAVLLIAGASNAVNLTDGLDGLAAGSGAFAFAAYTIVAFWQFRHDIYQVPHALDLAVVSASMLGACIGFLWWNAPPARIFMGDTGSLAIGTALAALALSTNTQLLLPIIGGLFVFETISVIVQVFTFRTMGGRRVFRMAPIHHHFELGGWPETTVIIRFWIMAGMCTAVGVGLFYADAIELGITQ